MIRSRSFQVHLALIQPGLSMSTRYDHIYAGDADEAVARAVASAEREFEAVGWQLDAVSEEATQ